MYRKIFLFTFLLLNSLISLAQSHLQPCGADYQAAVLKKRFPGSDSTERDMEEALQNALQGMNLQRFAHKGTGIYDDSIYYIPVVVHVVHFYGTEDISDDAIYDLVEGINKIYARSYFDSTNIINPYRGNISVSYNADPGGNPLPVGAIEYAGKADIRFRLATKDPEGKPTHGITRSLSNLYYQGSDQAKFDEWDPSAYLNIYFIGSFDENHNSAAAFAYVPPLASFVPYADGVIGLASYSVPSIIGHEIGHYLNVLHPWGSVNTVGAACGDDQVDDTPPTKGHISCSFADLYDVSCTIRRDTFGPGYIQGVFLPVADTINYFGIDFVAKTAINLNSVNIYPVASTGSPFQITLRHYGFTVATYDSVVTNNTNAQICHLNFSIAADSGYTLVLTLNPGTLRDSDVTLFLKDTTGIRLKNTDNNYFYNYFYNWKVTSGSATVAVGKPSIQQSLDTDVNAGQGFRTMSRVLLKTITIYPAAPSGTMFTIRVNRDSTMGSLVGTFSDTVITPYKSQRVPVNISIPDPGNYMIIFALNPGMLADTEFISSWVINAVMRLTQGMPVVDAGHYLNLFHNYDIEYGYARSYTNHSGGDSVVDYPDTVNTQNIMDYSFCDQMFTYGQTRRMRATLELPIAGRNQLLTAGNLIATGVWADSSGTEVTRPDLKVIPDFYLKNNKVFACADGAHVLTFQDHSWNDTVTARAWTFSNSPLIATAASATVNNKFSSSGWITVTLQATGNGTGDSTITRGDIAYAADPVAINPAGFWQEFGAAADFVQWPIFNYFHDNSHQWKAADAGYYDGHAMEFANLDTRTTPADELSSPYGQYADFFSPAFDLSDSSFLINCNLNFMSSGGSSTSDPAQQTDVFEISYSIDGGDHWIAFDSLTSIDLANAGVFTGPYTPSGMSDWKPNYMNLPLAVRGESQVYFRFRYKVGISKKFSLDSGGVPYAAEAWYHGTGNNFYLDRIYISNYPLGIYSDLAHAQGLLLAPNPTRGSATLTIPASSGEAFITVRDITGRTVMTTARILNGQAIQIEIPASVLSAKGMYFVTVAVGGRTQTLKLVVD